MKRLPLKEKKNQCFVCSTFQKGKAFLSFSFIILFVFKTKMKSDFHDKTIILFPASHALNIAISFKNRILPLKLSSFRPLKVLVKLHIDTPWNIIFLKEINVVLIYDYEIF